MLTSYLEGEPRFVSSVYETVNIEIRNDRSYWAGWSEWWDTDRTIVAVEHDVEISDELVDQIVSCKYPLATWAYQLYWPSVHGPSHYAQRTGLLPPAGGDWVTEGVEWCDYTGIGFCKIAPECRLFPLEESHWSHLDGAVSKAVVGRWRILWPEVAHYHV